MNLGRSEFSQFNPNHKNFVYIVYWCLSQDWTDEMKKLLQAGRGAAILKRKYLEMYNSLLEIPVASEDSSSTQRSLASDSISAPVAMGNFRRRFAEVR